MGSDLILKKLAVRGNHESSLLEGMPTECPNEEHMSLDEMEHHRWEHRLLSEESVAFLRGLPKRIDFVTEGLRLSVMHSCIDQKGRYSKSVMHPTEDDLLTMFADVECDVILYGHDHSLNVCKGEKLYINVGSLGCPSKARNLARAGVLTVENGKATVELLAVRYDVDAVIRRIDALHYPDAQTIKKIFYGL